MARTLGAVAGLLVLVVVAALVLLQSLDRPWLKRRLLDLARASAGVDIDYRAARIRLLSGADIEGLVVQSPAPVRAFAPDLLRVGRIEARWSPKSLLGHGPAIEALSVADVTCTVVVDEQGKTSFDFLPPSAPTPTIPLSRQASHALANPPALGRLDLGPLALVLVRTERGLAFDRTELVGLSAAIATSSAEPAARGYRVNLGFGSPAAPLDVALTRSGEGAPAAQARAKLWATFDADSSALTAALDLRMIEQTFVARVPADPWLHLEAGLRFDPAAGKTRVVLDHVDAGDGAATAEAAIEVPDTGPPVVLRARGDIDLARLLGWLPPGLVPVTADRAHLRYEVASLVAGAPPRLAEGGALSLNAQLLNVTVTAPSGSLRLGEGEILLQARPVQANGASCRGSARLARMQLARGDERLAADEVTFDLDGQAVDGVFSGVASARFGLVEERGASSAKARDGHFELRVQGLHPDADKPLATTGDLACSLDLASLDLRMPGGRSVVDGLALRAHATLEGHAPYGFDLEAPVTRLRVSARDGKLLADAPAQIEFHGRDLDPDFADPAASRGTVRTALRLGDSRASLDATKGTDSVDFALSAAAPSLKPVRPFLPPALAEAPFWDKMGIVVRSTGRVEHLRGAGPSLDQSTEVDVERAAFENVAAERVSLTVRSRGTALEHHAEADLRARGLAIDAGAPSDDHLSLSATVDRVHPSLKFELKTEGRAKSRLAGSLSFDPARRSVPYEMEGHLAGLAPLAAFAGKARGLDGFDLSQLELGLSAHGALLGVVAGISGDGVVELAPDPARTAAVEGTTDLEVTHFRWARGDTAVVAPSMAWHGEMHATGPRRTLDSRVEVGSLHVDLGARDVDMSGIADQATATLLGSLADPEIELSQHFSVSAIRQNALPEYPLGDVVFSLAAERSPEGVVHISELSVANGLGGTALAVTGNVNLGEGRRSLSLTTSLTQDLARLSAIPARFRGSGKLAVEATVTSPDLTHYGVRAALKGDDVNVALPRDGIEVETANGEVPITVTLEVGKRGVVLQSSEKRSPYSMLRFADQHPLLSRSGFLSIARLKTPFVSIAPLVGNLEVEQNVVSLRQFEMGIRGGSITGQCGIDWEGPKSTLELHVRANGVQSSHGEPFDGNIAVAISAADRTIDGRAEIVRIGESNLRDMLDLEDPLHVDPAMNRIRTALVFGYPESLRLVFDHGFANAHLQLGGLARLVSISEVRGIPMGPIVDKMLARMFDAPGMKEAP